MRLQAVVVGVGVLLVVAAHAASASTPAETAPGGAGPSDRASLRALVREVSRQHGVDPRLVDALVQVESDYDPYAVSRRGAIGLMQLMPATVRRMRIDDPFVPEDNVRAGVRELARLIERYSGNLELALAAYNAGEGAVGRYLGVPPFRETRRYVARIMTLYTGRAYRVPGGRRLAPEVRLLRDPATGRALITNVAPGAATGVAVERSSGRATVLRGGFGSSSR